MMMEVVRRGKIWDTSVKVELTEFTDRLVTIFERKKKEVKDNLKVSDLRSQKGGLAIYCNGKDYIGGTDLERLGV